MTKKKSSIGNFLESSRLMLANAKEDEKIRSLLNEYKVDDQRLEEGLALCAKGLEFEIKQIKLHGQQYRAYKQFEKALKNANEFYQIHLKFLRISYDKDLEKLKELSAFGKQPQNTPDWLKRAFAFYQNTINDPGAISELDFYGITTEMLQANEAKIYEVEAAYRAHKSKMGDAQDAIEKRDQILKEITVFMKKFIAICRTALRKEPQLLEKLGILVYSENYIKAKPKSDEEQPLAEGGENPAPLNKKEIEN